MKPTTQEIRKWYSAGGYGSHFNGCWQFHINCCIRMLCDEVDRLREAYLGNELVLEEIENRLHDRYDSGK